MSEMSAGVGKQRAKAHVVVIADRCKSCELCVVSCPMGNLKIGRRLNNSGYHAVEYSYVGTKGECTGCGLCYWVCPDFAIAEVKVTKP